MVMTAGALRAKIATDHARLRDLEGRIASGAPDKRRMFDAMIAQARADITKLEIQLAGMSDTCPACGEVIPPHFLVCRVCMREVPFLLYAAYKGAVGFVHHGLMPESTLAKAKAAILSHLKQHGSALA
jgi:ribosomal protein S14